MQKFWIVVVLLVFCGVVWFAVSRGRVPAAAETREAPEAGAAAAAEFVTEFLALLKDGEMKKVREFCDNPQADGLREQFELLRGVDLPEEPERVEFRTARRDSWSLYYPVDGGGAVQIVLRRGEDGSFRFKRIYCEAGEIE
ncbi:hypothetical protein [uncultured Victivallis sp.]|uniref:hypothetical protein n=1 Tax=uncultured Victivallis sp. TaxID=354118 RepID=UPI0025E88460|nr:hypothetical protein [uncultured Victivallis sp.]